MMMMMMMINAEGDSGVIVLLFLPAGHEVLHRGDLWTGAHRPGGRQSGRSHSFNQQQPVRQRHRHLHHQRSHGTQIHARGGRWPGETQPDPGGGLSM